MKLMITKKRASYCEWKQFF